MRRLLIIGLALVFAACGGGGDDSGGDASAAITTTSLPIAQMQAQASQVTDLLVAGRFDDVVSSFNAELHLAMSAASLKTAWEQVTTEFGAYKSRGATARSDATAVEGIAFDTPLTFAKKAAKCRITIDRDSKVAGLRILPADD